MLRRVIINGIILQGYNKKTPDTIIIEPTNICNLRCSCCPHGTNPEESRPHGFLTTEAFDKILNNIDVDVRKICLYLHGEPFLNKKLDYFIEQISKKGITSLIYSNGYNIDTGLLEKVLAYKRTKFHFSADILSKEHFESIRKPASYEAMLNNLDIINNLFGKHNRKFEIISLISSKDIENIRDISKEIFRRYDRLIKIIFGSRFPWPRYIQTGGELEQRLSKKRAFCNQIQNTVSIYWNGDCSLCSHDFSGKLIVGNMLENKLSALYNSKKIRKIRKLHYFQLYKKIPLCNRCVLPRYKSSIYNIKRTDILNNEKI